MGVGFTDEDPYEAGCGVWVHSGALSSGGEAIAGCGSATPAMSVMIRLKGLAPQGWDGEADGFDQVENVVNPPRNPVMMRVALDWRSLIRATMPMRKAPDRFTARVPAGRSESTRCWTNPESR